MGVADPEAPAAVRGRRAVRPARAGAAHGEREIVVMKRLRIVFVTFALYPVKRVVFDFAPQRALGSIRETRRSGPFAR